MKKRGLVLALLVGLIFLISFVSAAEPVNMSLIPAGNFTMGSNTACFEREDPNFCVPHQVTLDAFYMDKYEVTRNLWDNVVTWGKSHGYDFSYDNENGDVFNNPIGKGQLPVRQIPWYIMLVWSNARSEMEGLTPVYYTGSSHSSILKRVSTRIIFVYNNYVNWNANGYRLPTEAEWEYAARGNLSGKNYPWGDNKNKSLAGSSGLTNVGAYPANGYGLFDMAGNVQEWVWDCQDGYSSSAQTNPHGPDLGDCFRIGRGGSSLSSDPWPSYNVAYRPQHIRPAWYATLAQGQHMGFRTVRNYAIIPNCTASDWSPHVTPDICPSNGQKTQTWTKTNLNCQNGVQHPATENISCTYDAPDDDYDGISNDNDLCPNTPTGSNASRVGCPLPVMGRFRLHSSSLLSRNLNSLVSGFEFGNDAGKIHFNQAVKLISGNNPLYIDDYVTISQNQITLDSNMLPELNKSATLTFNNITFPNPVVLKDGVRCANCTSSFSNRVLTVNVGHFTSYRVVDETYFNPPPACESNWQCSDWGLCSVSGMQTRTCDDLSYCNDSSGKPSESQSCTIEGRNETPIIPPNRTCVPNCRNVECGIDDGCGKECWSCEEGESCDMRSLKCIKSVNFTWLLVGLGVVVLIFAAVVYYFLLMKKKK